MTPEEYRLLIPEYLSGRLTPIESEFFETAQRADAELARETAELRSLWEGLAVLPEEKPSPAMRAKFYQNLNALRRGESIQRKQNWFTLAWPKQLAAGALLLGVGLVIGRASLDHSVHKDEIAEMRSQVQGLQEMVALSLLERQSATSRLEGVSWSNKIAQPNEQLLNALVSAMNQDPNVNVRLSSIDTLEKFTSDGAISKALVNSIQRQDSPLVQVALIDALVRIKERSAEGEFKRLITASDINPSVRQRARWGLDKLTYQ